MVAIRTRGPHILTGTVVDSTALHPAGNTIYVDDTNGSDVTPIPFGYKTISAALAIPAVAGDVIEVAPGVYAEDINIPAGARVLGSNATLTGAVVLGGTDSYISLYVQTVATGTTGIILAGANTTGIADIRYQLCAGTADGISVTDSASTLFYSGTLQTVENGEGLSSGSAGSVFYDLQLIHVSGTGIGIYVAPTADATGYVGQIDDDGAGVGIYVEALGGVRLGMERIDCATAYNVEATAELILSVSEIVGARINAGTATIMEAAAVVAHVADITTNPHAVTAALAGADPAGSASGGDAAHLLAFTHADIATNTGARHTQGTDLGLDTGGTNPITAATAKGHVDSTANPHSTDVGNLGSGTISELNTAITDATMLGSVDEDDMTSDSATLVPTQQSVKAYVDTYRPKFYDVIVEDWLSDAAAGGGGVWDFLVDGATTPSGWAYAASGIVPSVCRINADGSYTLTMTRVAVNGQATISKVFTSQISSDPAMWPETKGFWDLDATGTTGVGGGQVIGHLKWYKPTVDYSIVDGRLTWAAPNWKYGFSYRTGEETSNGLAWNGDFQHLFTGSSVGSTVFSNANAGTWILAHKRTNPGALRPTNKELTIQIQWQIDNQPATVDTDLNEFWLWLY